MSKRENKQELSSSENSQWGAFGDAAKDLVEGAANDNTDGFNAALSQFQQIAQGLDIEKMLNAVHVPANAGDDESALRVMLERIPDGWGRWIGCDKGWHPIIVALDAQLQKVTPDYIIHQVKEKYGHLCFYASANIPLGNPADPQPPVPGKEVTSDWDSEECKAWRRENKAWRERLKTYQETTSEGKAMVSDAKLRGEMFTKLVRAAEDKAKKTCESCGAAGELYLTMAASPWYKTLCQGCATKEEGWIEATKYDAWWKEEEPKFLLYMKEQWVKRNKDKRFAVITTDTTKELGVPATYVRDVEEAERIARAGTGKYDGVFVGDDGIGEAYLLALEENYRALIRKNEQVRKEAWADRNNNYLTERPEDCPWIYYLHPELPCPRMMMQDLGASCWFAQDEHLKA